VCISCGADVTELLDDCKSVAECDGAGKNPRRKDIVFRKIRLDLHNFGEQRARLFGLMGLDHNSPAVLKHDTGPAADTRLMDQSPLQTSAKHLPAKRIEGFRNCGCGIGSKTASSTKGGEGSHSRRCAATTEAS
jgi:hypothetical protein